MSVLPAEDLHRLTVWLDSCSMFYGVYEKEGGEAQLRGEIVRPTLEWARLDGAGCRGTITRPRAVGVGSFNPEPDTLWVATAPGDSRGRRWLRVKRRGLRPQPK